MYVYLMTPCSTRRARQERVTHLLLVCRVNGGVLETLPADEALLDALRAAKVRYATQHFEGARYLYVHAPKDRMAYVSDPQRHRYLSGGVVESEELAGAYREVARALARLA